MAEGFARAMGRGRVEAFSAGSRPSRQVDSRAITFMQETGIDISGHESKGLDDLPVLPWDYLVTMGCGDECPALPARHRVDWDLADPKPLDDAGFRTVRDQIARRVAALLADAR
jgi:arsenate reductase